MARAKPWKDRDSIFNGDQKSLCSSCNPYQRKIVRGAESRLRMRFRSMVIIALAIDYKSRAPARYECVRLAVVL